MHFELPALPYPKDALAPYISEETFEFHHGKHHAAYVNKLNSLIEGTQYDNMPLEDIIKKADGGIFNNAAQTWNHSFFWNCMSPSGGGRPDGALGDAIARDFGSFEGFKKEFCDSAIGLFGSGWCWLARDGDRLEILPMSNAGTPLKDNKVPVLTLDVWEHAYYIDYRNGRPKFVDGFWDVVNWQHCNAAFQG